MSSFVSVDFLQFMLRSISLREIERTLHPIRREMRVFEDYHNNMANENKENNKAMKDYLAPTLGGFFSCIVRPPIQANNFEFKISLI